MREHMTLHLTWNQKVKWAPLLDFRDNPEICLYCGKPYPNPNNRDWDHLDNIESHNYPENLVRCCHSCNVKKITNEALQARALIKLKENQESDLSTYERTLADTGTTKEVTSQQEINRINYPIAEQFILERTLTDDELILKQAVNAIVDICQKNNNTGSQSAVYRYIDSFTNPYTGKYTLSTNSQGKTIIRRRNEN